MTASNDLGSCCATVIVGKASLPGRCKTRLMPALTADEAALCNTAFLQDIATNIAVASQQVPIHGYVTCHPDGSELFFRSILPSGFELIHPPVPGLQSALEFCARSLLETGYGAVCLVNSDSPNLPTRQLILAAQALRDAPDRVVIGPSDDGGYYLIGMNHWHAHLFTEISWSTAHVTGQTRQRAAEINLEVVMLESWYDVDDAAALQRLATDLLDTGDDRCGVAARSAELLGRLRASGRLPQPVSRS